MTKGRTAILYFAYRPDVEAVRKPIFSGHSHAVNVRFYQELQDELFDQVSPLGLPLLHIDDRQQQGSDFGERFCNAIEEVWKEGYEKVLILGNDSPELSTEDYQQALELLDAGHTCLVPTQNGGTALIGVDKARYNRALWMDVQWQSSNTFHDLFDCLADCKIPLTEVVELNSIADIYQYMELHRGKDAIAFLIDSLLNPLRNFVSLDVRSKELNFQTTRKLRGPPFKC